MTSALITCVYLMTTWPYIKQACGVARIGAACRRDGGSRGGRSQPHHWQVGPPRPRRVAGSTGRSPPRDPSTTMLKELARLRKVLLAVAGVVELGVVHDTVLY